jgi:glycosyltransferase involved in cell wall biosynthesis
LQLHPFWNLVNIMVNLTENMLTQSPALRLPSFSIVFETENLSSVELENIYQSLDSLANQAIPPEQANEFLIIDSGDAPAEVLEHLCSLYPWITVQQASDVGYHEAKMMGATLVTGDIVIFCDSDCVYKPNWLRDVLTLFSQSLDINIVAGETSTPVRNSYELAVAMHYFFPRFSGQNDPYKTSHYFLNGVGFRRNFLLENPLPTNLPTYRGNCQIHIYNLCHLKGHSIWKHPKAQAIHEPPTISFISWRYLLMGRDRVLKKQIKLRLKENSANIDYSHLSVELNLKFNQKIRALASTAWRARPFHLHQIRTVLREDQRRLVLFPLAVPIMLWFELLYTLGSAVTYFWPHWLLKVYKELERTQSEANSPDHSRVKSALSQS